jgi:hypothetical protein
MLETLGAAALQEGHSFPKKKITTTLFLESERFTVLLSSELSEKSGALDDVPGSGVGVGDVEELESSPEQELKSSIAILKKAIIVMLFIN